ncbi:hypothetical protein N7462_006643 [Penicillium macrosclerotiorum]|uniref:uncharacterized protein n=1 Tax=Penicillium macrosclerotiorum TaxID=303699 RepID=UPI0025498A17|nr:uncharacterized protein N7462_006643 [Penicillium macrosclerotiorum]KAJ5683478.1 hypothetical protein N7462_006643 [Penicillium macrosclerotiorum]
MKLLAAFLALTQSFLVPVNASPWIGTEYIAIVETTVVDGFTNSYLTETPWVETETIRISPTGTNPSVISTFTSVDTFSSDVTAVNLVVAPTAGAAITSDTYYNYYVNVVYTAPSSCSYTTSQTLTTAIPIYMPYEAKALVHPTAVVTSIETYVYLTYRDTNTMAMLAPSDIPPSVLASASSYYAPARYTACSNSYYNSGLGTEGSSSYSDCDEFTWYIGNSPFSGGYCCDDGCHYTWGITPWGLALAIFFGWFGLFLIIGLVESWYIFRRAMLGHKARRGLPYGFACLCPVLSCLFLLSVKKHPAKTPDQQAWLAARWNEISVGTKLGLWLKNFFSRRDPAAQALGFSGPAPPPQAAFAPQSPIYPPVGTPGAPGMPPMGAYHTPTQQGYPMPMSAPRGEELAGEPKTVTVNEHERTQ